ncbi:MAG: hypothetical protein J7M05_12120 [Anaerolineae bacterium]|nr:hypothetical protein [Anaerolineae bacterium]
MSYARSKGQHLQALWFPCLLAVLILLLYGPSLRFGLIWDDPTWYQQGMGEPLWRILLPLPTFQFYRPLAILLNRLLSRPDGTVRIQWAHFIQISAHLGTVLLSIPVLQALGFTRWHARLSALLFAIHPFAYQAVAWQAPQQPLALLFVLLATWLAHLFQSRGQAIFLAGSLLTYGLGLLFQESVLPFLFLFFWLALLASPQRDKRKRLWPLWHTALALSYVFVWLHVPRHAEITGRGLQLRVLGYLLQGWAYPLAPLANKLWPELTPLQLVVLLSALWGILALGLSLLGQGKPALLSTLWAITGIAPVWIGLSWHYACVGSRLLYPAIPGIAGLWAGWVAQALVSRKRLWILLGGSLLFFTSTTSAVQQWSCFQRLYQIGTSHLQETIKVIGSHPGGHLLFINFPDRLELRPRLYPLGFWGLTLAPVIQDLSDYALSTTGQAAETRSLSSFVTGWHARESWPYRVDMRGENAPPDRLFKAAQWADTVYLTNYLPNGSLELCAIGTVLPDQALPATATFGDRVQLVHYKTERTPRGLLVKLLWRPIGNARSGDTIFLHLLTSEGRYVRGRDGDALGGMLPLESWQPGWLVYDYRFMPTQQLPEGSYVVTVGLYNRDNGQRYPAIKADGTLAYEGELPIQTISFPASHSP